MTNDAGTRAPSLTRALGERQLWILLGLVVFFFARPLFFGETFFFRDLTLLAFPQRVRLVELVRSCGLPLWDPYLHGGQPFLANPSNVALYPTALLYFVLPAITAFNLEIVFHFLLCALAVYLLSRTLGLAPVPSLVAGAAFTLCGFTLSTANLLNRLLAMPNMVFLLLFWHLFLLRRKSRWFLGAVASGVLVVLAGSVEFLLLTLAIALGWALAYSYPPGSPRPLRRAIAWMSLCVAILGVAAVAILPGLEVVRQSARGAGLNFEEVSRWSLDPRRLPEIFVPGFLGPTQTLAESDYWGAPLEEGYPVILSIFFGLAVIVLALMEGATRAEDRLPGRFRRFLLAVACAAIVLALGRFALLTPFSYRAIPFASVFRYPIKALAAAVLPVALLAGGGAERLLRGESPGGRRGRGLVWCLAAAAGLFVLLAVIVRAGGPLASAFVSFFFRSGAGEKGLPQLAPQLLHAALAAIALALLLAASRSGRRPWLATALVGLVVVELAVAGRPVNPSMPRALLAAEPPLAAFVRGHLAGGRLFRDATPASHVLVAPSNDILWRSLWRRETLDFYGGIAFGIPVIFHDDYDGLAQRRLVRLTSTIARLPWDRRLPLICAGNATVIVAGEPLAVAGLELVAEVPNHSNLPFYLYRNLTAAPRVGFVSTAAFVGSETDAVRALLSRGFDPRHHVVLEGPAASRRGGGCGEASVIDVERRPDSWKGRVTAPCDGFLVFSEPYYPGWKGSVDGAAGPVLRANLAFSAIAIPAGTHLVSKIYRPTSVTLGATLSVVSALLAVVVGRALASG